MVYFVHLSMECARHGDVIVRTTDPWDTMPTALINLLSKILHNRHLATSSSLPRHDTYGLQHTMDSPLATTQSSFRFVLITFSPTHSSPTLSDIFSWLNSHITSSLKLSLNLQKINCSLLRAQKVFEPISDLDITILSCNFLFA